MNPARRPPRLVFVTATGTEVGKTWLASRLAERLRAGGLSVAARKPVQSFDPGQPGPTDAEALAAATGEMVSAVCPSERTYPVAMAPPMAAEALGRPVPTLDQLALLRWPVCDVGLVEGAGGVLSPLAAGADNADLARRLGPDVVVLVAHAGLGVIHSVRASALALVGLPLAVYLNYFDPGDDLHARNRDWLVGRSGLNVHTSPDSLARFVSGERCP